VTVGAMLVRHDAASAAFVRHQLARDLGYYDLPEDAIDDVLLVASELLGNAVRHTTASPQGTIDVSWDVDASGVRVCVGDASDEPPVLRFAGVDEPSGRGLQIVAAVSDEWGVERAEHGKRVWAHVPAPLPQP
jgi:anti-sigma regulatory factor (Ser/Thr protein kinase)